MKTPSLKVRAAIVSSTFTLGVILAGCSTGPKNDDAASSAAASASSKAGGALSNSSASSSQTDSDPRTKPQPNEKPVSLPEKISVGLKGAQLDAAILSGTSERPTPISVGSKPTTAHQVNVPAWNASGAWAAGSLNSDGPTNPVKAHFAMVKNTSSLISKTGPIVLNASMKNGVVANGPFKSFTKVKPGQRVWVTGGIAKLAVGYDIISAQTVDLKTANALATQPEGAKRLVMIFPAGNYDAKTGAYTKRTVIVALAQDKKADKKSSKK